uniref:FAD synthase n=1 Tax=Lutzomyia longipalpis TaxID=7200 RepID=A0A7G3ABC2_LUTLO
MSQTSQTSEFPSAPDDDSVGDFCKKILKSRIFLGEFREKRLVEPLDCYRDVIIVSAQTETAIANDLDIVRSKLIDVHAGKGDVQWIGLTRNTGQSSKGLESVSVWTELDSFYTFGKYWFQIRTIRFRNNEILLKLKVLRSVDDVAPQQTVQELPFKWEDIDWPLVERLGRDLYTWAGHQARNLLTSLLSIRISTQQVISTVKMFIFFAITAVVSTFHAVRAIGEFAESTGVRYESSVHQQKRVSVQMESTAEVDQVSNGTEYSHSLQVKVQQSTELFRRAFRDYPPERIFLSFNGGKDCTVLLHMVIKFLEREGISVNRLPCWYFQPHDPFAEVEEFVIFCETYYGIEIKHVRGTIREALGKICNSSSDGEKFEACFMGSRRTDPYCSDLDYFQKTDAGWPDLMRISPLLDWTCNDVWEYLQKNHVPYCKLYDVGYTSLGGRENTTPNPNLRYVDPKTGEIKYYPAYCLRNDGMERAGRS